MFTIWGLILLVILFVLFLIIYAAARQAISPSSPSATELVNRLSMVGYMSGAQFEIFVADVMRGLGYRATVLGGSGDQGVDVLAVSNNEKIAIQCKRYSKPVGNKPIQEVYAGAHYHGYATAWVVASSGFTKNALELANRLNVSLYDAHSLKFWIRQVDKREKAFQTSEAYTVDLDEKEEFMGIKQEKHTVRVGVVDGNVGETVSFTAENLGTAAINGGKEYDDGMDFTFYRLPDGNFRVFVERGDFAVLEPSDMDEALDRGQRNNFSYGRMTLEELQAHEYNFGEVYEQLMKSHPDTVRDID